MDPAVSARSFEIRRRHRLCLAGVGPPENADKIAAAARHRYHDRRTIDDLDFGAIEVPIDPEVVADHVRKGAEPATAGLRKAVDARPPKGPQNGRNPRPRTEVAAHKGG